MIECPLGARLLTNSTCQERARWLKDYENKRGRVWNNYQTVTASLKSKYEEFQYCKKCPFYNIEIPL